MPVWGRKAIMTLAFLVAGIGFGVFCVEKKVSLTDAGIYWGSVTVGLLGYHGANVFQKNRSVTNGNVGGAEHGN